MKARRRALVRARHDRLDRVIAIFAEESKSDDFFSGLPVCLAHVGKKPRLYGRGGPNAAPCEHRLASMLHSGATRYACRSARRAAVRMKCADGLCGSTAAPGKRQ